MQDDNTILVCPGAKFVGFRKTMKGKKIQINYFLKFKSIHVTLNENEVEQFIVDEVSQRTNKLTDVFTIKIDEITETIVKHFRFVQKSTNFDTQPVLIDPYIFGLWLGDGSSNGCALTTIDKPIYDIWCTYLTSQGLNLRYEEKDRVTQYHENELSKVTTIYGTKHSGKTNFFISALKNMGVFKNKHIPSEYLQNSEEYRLKLLAGLIDTDGSLDKTRYEITQKNRKLAENIVSLCNSLGFYTTIKETIKSCTNSSSGKHSNTYHRIHIFLSRFTKNIPVRLQRKVQKDSIKYSNCPRFDFKGIPIMSLATDNCNWTNDLNQILFNVVESFKVQEPNQSIPWAKLKNYNSALKGIKPDGLRAQYKDKIEPNKEKYTFENIELDLIPQEWKMKYDTICTLIQNNTFTSNTKEYVWYNNIIKHKNSMYICKKNLLDKISALMPKTNRATLYENLCILRDMLKSNTSIENVRLIEDKLLIPANTTWNNIGRTVSQMKMELKKENINWNNITSKDELLKTYSDLLHDSHLGRCSKNAVFQYDETKNIINTFDSCIAAAKYLKSKNLIESINTGKCHVSTACKNDVLFVGYYWKTIHSKTKV